MKKILACLIVALMLVMALASCEIGGSTSATDPAPVVNPLEAARDFLKAKFAEESEQTPADYTRPTLAPYNGAVYSVSWSVEVTEGDATDVVIEAIEGDDTKVLVNVNEEKGALIKYILTATITAEGYEPVVFSLNERSVPVVGLMSWQEYMDAAAGDLVSVQGVVTAISSPTVGGTKNSIWMQDNNGGYYIYGLSVDPIADLGVQVGMTVKVKGTKDIYNGTHEVKDATVEIVDSAINVPAATDYTAIFQNNSLSSAALTGNQALLVTIKGVTVLPQDGDTTANGYYKFKMGDNIAYIRISGSECAISKADQATFKAANAEHAGWTADVTGLVCVYSNNFYLIPVSVDAFDYKEAPSCECVASSEWSKDGLNHWHVCSICGLSMGDSAPHSIVGTACSACGYAPVATNVADANAQATTAGSETYILTGIVDEIANTQYGNMYIKDENGNRLYIYGFYSADGTVRFDALGENQPQVGDIVVVYGQLSVYSGAAQMKNARMISCETPEGGCQHTPSAEWTYNASKHWHVCSKCGENKTDETYHNYANGSSCADCGYTAIVATLPEAIALGAAQKNGAYTTDAYIVTGVIKSIVADKNDPSKPNAYGNMYIQDAEGNELYVYGVYSANGKDKFEKLDPQPQVGDTITLIGILGKYNDTVQLKSGSLVAHSVPAPHEHEAGAEWLKDADNHWNVCACGEIMNKAAHDFSNGNCVCGQEPPHVHAAGSEWLSDADSHWNVCACGEIMNKAAHDFSNGDCACGKEAPVCEHASDAWLSDDNNHWKVCDECGETFGTAAHEFVDGADCICGKEAPHVHAPEADYSYDDDNHWQECACGEIMNKAAHDFSNGDCVCGKEAPAAEQMTIAEVLASEVGAKVVFTGIVTGIQTAYNDQFGNISVYVSDATGTILAYRLTGNWAINDIITITGTFTIYNGTKETAQGATAVKVGTHTCTQLEGGSCTVASTCAECGATHEAPGHNYVNGACTVCKEAEPVGQVLPEKLTFGNLQNNKSADSYLKSNFPEWTISGKLGNGYLGYLGFGRSGDRVSSIKSSKITTTTAFNVVVVLKGNGGGSNTTSTLTFTLVDEDGKVVATGYADGSSVAAVTPVEGKDGTHTISFTFVEGKSWSDVSNLVVSFAKATGNIGMKSLEFIPN